MSVIQNFLLATPEGYQISRSVRLRSSASAYFNRTTTTPTNGSIFTHSFWVKRGILGSLQTLISGARPTNFDRIYFSSTDTLVYQWNDGTSNLVFLETTQVFRDPSAWYHIVVATDTTQATSTNRVKFYVNGVQITAFTSTTYPSQNSTSYLNINARTLNLGRTSTAVQYLDGYLTEINFIDGQALDPSSFGETNPVTGVWQPKKYTGTYGTNGFFLNFSDNSAATAAAIGKDYSGNGNDWTPNNISVTAGVTYDSMLDVPTQWADGGNGRGNYAVASPIDISGGVTSEANLRVSYSTAFTYFRGTISVNTGKYYLECLVASMGGAGMDIGFGGPDMALTGTSSRLQYRQDGSKVVDAAVTSYGATYTTSDVIGAAIDFDAGTCTFYKNNVSQGSISFTANRTFAPMGYMGASGSQQWNFGQRPFTYTPPTGFKALNTLNLPTPTILKGNQYFDATLWTGNGSTQTITNSGSMQPDLVWYKRRNSADNNRLFDSVRGVTKPLFSDLTNAESTESGVTAFNSNGFSLGLAGNESSNTYVGWQWKEGATQGFDIVTYTGTGANRTIAHNLGVAPSMIIFRARSIVENWPTWHKNLTAADYVLTLNTTNAQASVPSVMNSTAPTSSVFSVGTSAGSNSNGATYVAYLFSEVAGFSRAFSYTGNGSADGPFIFTGFRPRFILIKESTPNARGWRIFDTARSPSNQAGLTLSPNTSDAEDSGSGLYNQMDILSNGFKLRAGTNSEPTNESGATYIGFAWAEVPFKNSLAR